MRLQPQESFSSARSRLNIWWILEISGLTEFRAMSFIGNNVSAVADRAKSKSC